MSADYLADIRRFMSSLDDSLKELITFRPLALRPVEIADLLDKLQGMYDISASLPETDVILIGSNVRLINMLDFCELSFQMMLPKDSDPAQGKITVLSPLGSKLLGRHRGETINIFYGNRMNRFRIISVDQKP